MTDRDRDLKRLKLMGDGRRESAVPMLISLACTAMGVVLAFHSSTRGNCTLILVALLMSLSSVFMVIQYSVSGPLIREVQRLRAELDEVRGREQSR